MKPLQGTNETDPGSVSLAALGWILSDDQARADRLLAATGLTPDALRAGLADPALLAAILAFLEAHEPDLVACAAAIGETPEALVAARQRLEA
ncbi:MAG: DUF3572 family protein [Sphingomonas fennica]